jgi:hypothetical protein
MTARGVLNDAVSIYFAEATLASAFVARWCVGAKVESAGGVFQVREDEPEARVGAGPHKTPEGGEITSVSGTRDHHWSVVGSAWKLHGRPKLNSDRVGHIRLPRQTPARRLAPLSNKKARLSHADIGGFFSSPKALLRSDKGFLLTFAV